MAGGGGGAEVEWRKCGEAKTLLVFWVPCLFFLQIKYKAKAFEREEEEELSARDERRLTKSGLHPLHTPPSSPPRTTLPFFVLLFHAHWKQNGRKDLQHPIWFDPRDAYIPPPPPPPHPLFDDRPLHSSTTPAPSLSSAVSSSPVIPQQSLADIHRRFTAERERTQQSNLEVCGCPLFHPFSFNASNEEDARERCTRGCLRGRKERRPEKKIEVGATEDAEKREMGGKRAKTRREKKREERMSLLEKRTDRRSKRDAVSIGGRNTLRIPNILASATPHGQVQQDGYRGGVVWWVSCLDGTTSSEKTTRPQRGDRQAADRHTPTWREEGRGRISHARGGVGG